MALQGTLDTFTLPDVLHLLAATRKCGRLRVCTGRTSADLWIDAGHVVAAGFSGVDEVEPDATIVLFELLRAPEGTFEFHDGDRAGGGAGAGRKGRQPSAESVAGLLERAEALLAEWRELEAVVPSADAWVALRDPLPSAKVTVDAATWRAVVAVGHGEPVGALRRVLGLDEMEAARVIKRLVEAGLVTVAPTWESPDDQVAEEHDEVDPGGGDEADGPFDRDVLLRFLSTVR